MSFYILPPAHSRPTNCRSWKKHDRQRAATWSVILSWLSRITPKSDTDVENDTVSRRSSISLMPTFDSCWRIPIHISWVLSVFILSLFACIQPSISSMHSENRRAVTDDSEAGTLRCTCVSSAYECATSPFLLMTSNSSAVYSMKRRGPRTEPCGTPKSSRPIDDNRPIYTIQHLLGAAHKERPDPFKHTTADTKSDMQPIQLDSMIYRVEGST